MQVRRLLGCGTFGRVRLVVDKAGGQSYALKGMRKEQARRYYTSDGHTYYGSTYHGSTYYGSTYYGRSSR